MKRFCIFPALLALTGIALSSVKTAADDDMDGLDVTMEVLDDEAEFDELASEMRGPNEDGLDKDDFEVDLGIEVEAADREPEYDFQVEVDKRDEFEDDQISDADKLRYEDEFEDLDGEDVDLEDDYDDAEIVSLQ